MLNWLIVMMLAIPTQAIATEYLVIFGEIKKQPNGNVKITSTDRIPLKSKETGFEFGVYIEATTGSGFSGYVEYLLPAPAGGISGSLYATDQYNRVIRNPFTSRSNKWLGNIFFHQGDPAGIWFVDVYIDDNKVFHQKFHVLQQKVLGSESGARVNHCSDLASPASF